MTGQLDLFTSLGRESQASPQDAPTPPDERASRQASSRPRNDYAGQLGDDGSLHFMLTGQPEPKGAAA